MNPLTDALEKHQFAYLTTTGRRTGQPHRIEIWFVVIDGSVWVASGGRGRSDWVKNLSAESNLILEIDELRLAAVATIHPDLVEHRARQRLAARYQDWDGIGPLSAWATESLLVEVTV